MEPKHRDRYEAHRTIQQVRSIGLDCATDSSNYIEQMLSSLPRVQTTRIAALVLLMTGALTPNVSASAQDAPIPAPRRVPLDELLETVESTNPSISQARIGLRRADAAHRIALAGVLPTIQGTLSYTRFDQAIVRDSFVVRQEETFAGALVIAGSLSAARFYDLEIADARSDVERANLRAVNDALRATASSLYAVAQLAEVQASLAGDQLAAAQRQANAIRTRYEAGTALRLDVARGELAVLSAQQRLTEAQAAFARACDELGLLVGTAPIAPIAAHPETTIDLASLPETLSDVTELALSRRADLDVLTRLVALRQREYDGQWLSFLPTVNLSWTLSYTPQTTAFQPNPVQWNGVLGLAIPIFDGGARYGRLRDADAALADARSRRDQRGAQIATEVRGAERQLTLARQNMTLALAARTLAQESQTLAETAYREGALTALELDGARDALVNAENTVSLRWLEMSQARIEVERVLGR